MIELFKLLRNKRMFMLMIAVILFIAVIGFSLSDRKELTWPEKFLGDTVGYAQELFYKPAGFIAGFFEDIRNLRTIYEENEQLKLTAAAYARDKINYNFVQKENERYMKYLKFTERQQQMNNYEYMIAQVIAVDNDTYNRTMVINLGSKNGVEPNMAVTTVDGLVGLVSEVRPFTSTIMPITGIDETSPTSNSIAATILGREDESFGIISSYDQETDRLLMTKIAEDDKMIVDDVVITSGLGNVYPRGLVIGTVENKQVGDFGLTLTASVDLAAKFEHLTEVFVVKVQKIEENEE